MKILNYFYSALLAFEFVRAKSIYLNKVVKNNIPEINIVGNRDVIENTDFKYNFHCIEDVNGICVKIIKEINIALNDLSSTFDIKQQIFFEAFTINATAALEPSNANLVACATDINFVSLKSSSDLNAPPYAYTQALAKQLNTNRKVNFKKNDFIIYFNIDLINFLLFLNPNTSLSTIILHEIIHGLGFLCTGSLYNFESESSNVYRLNMKQKEEY